MAAKDVLMGEINATKEILEKRFHLIFEVLFAREWNKKSTKQIVLNILAPINKPYREQKYNKFKKESL